MDFECDRKYIEKEFCTPAWDETGGLAVDALREGAREIYERDPALPIGMRRAQMITYILDNAQIAVDPHDYFVDQFRHGNIALELAGETLNSKINPLPEIAETQNAVLCRAYTGERDLGHTCPDWRAILHLGIPGLLQRLMTFRSRADAEHTDYYDEGIMVYEALLRLLNRMADTAERFGGDHGITTAGCLRNLACRAPETFHEALELSLVMYWVQSSVEGANVRSLGRFDALFGPYYDADIASGRATEDELKELLRYYFCHWNAANIVANIPITLCGLDESGKDVANRLTRAILEVYGELDIISPKFHIRVNDNTPQDILEKVCDLIRGGTNSFVFCNDKVVEHSLEKLGESEDDARDYVMVGCYESTSLGREIACSTNGKLSLPKAVEYAMTGGVDLLTGQQIGLHTPTDFPSFDAFCEAVEEQIAFLANGCMKRIAAIERIYPQAFTAPIFSGQMISCVSNATDAYDGGAKYNHSSINAFGLATAVDALMAVRRQVFDQHTVSLPQWVKILRNNWKNAETLRTDCRKHTEKYGNHEPTADKLAARLIDVCAKCINGKPNGRKGVFRLGSFSIDWRFDFGEHTAASADGRLCGETLSKNLSASQGMDKNGATALILSASALDYSKISNGAVLDLMLHGSAVAGEEGLGIMLGLLKTYFESGGMALQCNILDAETLRCAQREPEAYANLQVRLCGWNVRFVNLSEKEQNELIEQAAAAS